MKELITDTAVEPKISQYEYVNAVVFNEAGQALVIEAQSPTQAIGKWGMIEATISDRDDPLAAVQNALLAQTGYQTSQWNYVGTYLRNNYEHQGAGHIFIALSAKKRQDPEPPCAERAPRWITREELRYGLIDGRILSFRYALNVALALLMALEAS